MKFYLKIYDNFHYGDEAQAYNYGEYSSYEDAIIAAQQIVQNFLKHNWKKSISSEELFSQFCLYGEEPVILPNEHRELSFFSARTYAEDIVETICEKFEKSK